MYENNTAAVKVGNEVSNWFSIKSEVKQGCVLFPFIWIILMDFVLRSTGKAIGDHGIKWGGKTLLDSDYADDLSILNESLSKMNEFLEVGLLSFSILILDCRLIFLFFQAFYNFEKTPRVLAILLSTSSLLPPSLIIILPR